MIYDSNSILNINLDSTSFSANGKGLIYLGNTATTVVTLIIKT